MIRRWAYQLADAQGITPSVAQAPYRDFFQRQHLLEPSMMGMRPIGMPRAVAIFFPLQTQGHSYRVR